MGSDILLLPFLIEEDRAHDLSLVRFAICTRKFNYFTHSIWSKLAAAFAYTSLSRLKKKIDPRNVNGGVFLGLNGTVVKSHGGADAKGNAAAFKLAYTLGQNRFADKLAARVASAATLPQDILHEGEPGLTSGQEGEQN